MKALAQIFALLLAVALPGAVNAQVRLTDVVTFGADASGSWQFQPDSWDTQPGGNFNNWLQSLPSGTFLNGPSDDAAQPNITLVTGTNSFRIYGSPGVDNANFGINLFFSGAATPSISAFGSMLTSSNQVHSFAADSATFTPANVPVYNSGIPGAGTLTFETSSQVITLTDFYLATPLVFNLDQASQTSLGSDGVLDYVGGFTLVVSNKNNASDCTPPPAGIVGWWKGDGTAVDVVAGNNGTLLNASYTNGVDGLAFAFDPENYPYGTHTGVQIADSPAYVLTNALTIEAWARPRGDGYFIFFRGDHRPGTDPYWLAMTGNNILEFLISDENGNSASVTTPLVYGAWVHLAATYDGSTDTMKLYTNGVLAAQTVTSVHPFGLLAADQSPGVGIGNLNDGGNNFPFDGDIDEVALYNRALTTNEITSIYNAGSAGKCTSATSILQQPANQTTVAGSGATLTVGLDGIGPFTYQWRFNGTNISGATNATLTLTNLHDSQSGHYSVVITTPDGILTSADAIVTVIPQDILIYNYSGKEQITTFSQDLAYNYSGQMLLIPAGTNGTFVGWATINGKKQYWVSPLTGYLWINLARKNSHNYTILGHAGDGIDSNGYPHLWSSLHRGVNTQLAIAKKRTFSFPNIFTSVDNHIYPDPNTGNIIMVDASSTYQFALANTQSANNNSQTLPDLINALAKSLEKQGYQKQ